jgi:integrase/recombinase XerD
MASGTNFDSPEELIEAFCRFLTKLGNSPHTVKERKGDLLTLVRWSEAQNEGHFDLSDFVTKRFEPYRAWLFSQFKESTVSRRLTSANLFFNWSVRQDLLHPRALPIINSIKLKPRSIAASSWLQQSDVLRLLEAVRRSRKPDEIAIVTLLSSTGLRISDIRTLRWQDVNVNEGTIRLARAKFGQRLHLPIHNPDARHAIQALAALKGRSQTEFIFQQTRRAIVMLIERYSKVAGLPKVSPKMLRNSFIMNLVSTGTDPRTVALLAGFERVEMTKPYFESGISDYLRSVSRSQKMM